MSLSGVVNIFKIPDIRKKIFITLGILFIYRIGFHIPLPGVNHLAMRGLAEGAGGGSVLGIMNVLSGGQLQIPVLFSLGILPYISSSIIFSLLVKVVPSLEALSKEGPAGQKKINQLTRLFTVPLCMLQGTVLVVSVFKPLSAPVAGQEGVTALVVPALSGSFGSQFGAGLMIVLGMTAGTLFVMWLGEQITEFGLGNGASLIIMAGIVAGMPSAFLRIFQDATENRGRILIVALLILCYIAVVIAVVMITKGQRRIPIQQAKLMKGRRMVGGAKHYLPLKVNMANVMPVIFASSLLMFPNLFASALGKDTLIEPGGWWYLILFIGLIFFFSFFWTSMMFQPTDMANNLKEYGSFVPGIRPGRRTAEYLERIMIRVTLAGGAFLATIAILPTIVASTLNVDWLTASFLGGTGILIVVGVALDLVDKLNAQLLQRNYEGFMSASAAKRGGRGS